MEDSSDGQVSGSSKQSNRKPHAEKRKDPEIPDGKIMAAVKSSRSSSQKSYSCRPRICTPAGQAVDQDFATGGQVNWDLNSAEFEDPSIIYYFQRISTRQLQKLSRYYYKKVKETER